MDPLGKPVPGRRLNEPCPICKEGRLRPVTRLDEGSNGIYGPGGHAWSYHRLERLGCSRCSASFEIEASLRNVPIEDVLRDRLKGFKNPATQPAACPDCPDDPLVEHTRHERFSRFDRESIRFLCCSGCFRIQWILEDTKAERNAQIKKALERV